ncbi:MAG: STAS domain-containing protein [Anaerolineaceae bacterium]
MEITTTRYKHSDLVKATGRIDSATAPRVAETLNAIMDEGRYKLILDMGDVTFISSAGLRVLVNTQKACRRYNRGELALTNLPPNIHSALDLAGFTAMFQIFDDNLTAVGSF